MIVGVHVFGQSINLCYHRLLTHHNALRRGFGIAEITRQSIRDELAPVAQEVLSYMDRTWSLLEDLRHQMTDAEFDASLGSAIGDIYTASTTKTA